MHNLLAEVPHMGGEEETLNLVSTFNKETTKLFCVYVLKSMIKLRIKVTAIQGKAVFFYISNSKQYIALHIYTCILIHIVCLSQVKDLILSGWK